MREQVDGVVALVRDVLGEDVVGAYLHGSSVLGGLGPRSDIDVLVVSRRPTTRAEKRRLVDGMRALSIPPGRLAEGRPLELTSRFTPTSGRGGSRPGVTSSTATGGGPSSRPASSSRGRARTIPISRS